MAGAVDSSEDLSFGEYRLDRVDERLWGPDGVVRLGNKAFQVLLRLAEQQGRLLTKEALFSSVWDGTIVSESALTSVIKELRRALGDDPKNPRFIESVYGRGYRFLPEVTGSAATPPIAAAPAREPAAAASRLGAAYVPSRPPSPSRRGSSRGRSRRSGTRTTPSRAQATARSRSGTRSKAPCWRPWWAVRSRRLR